MSDIDLQCINLARHFLSDAQLSESERERAAQALAELLQTVVEDFMEELP